MHKPSRLHLFLWFYQIGGKVANLGAEEFPKEGKQGMQGAFGRTRKLLAYPAFLLYFRRDRCRFLVHPAHLTNPLRGDVRHSRIRHCGHGLQAHAAAFRRR